MAQPDRKSKIKLGQYASKWSNVRFGQKIRSTLGQIISGIKCDRDKLIFFIERGGQQDRIGHKRGWKMKKMVKLLTTFKLWKCSPLIEKLL